MHRRQNLYVFLAIQYPANWANQGKTVGIDVQQTRVYAETKFTQGIHGLQLFIIRK